MGGRYEGRIIAKNERREREREREREKRDDHSIDDRRSDSFFRVRLRRLLPTRTRLLLHLRPPPRRQSAILLRPEPDVVVAHIKQSGNDGFSKSQVGAKKQSSVAAKKTERKQLAEAESGCVGWLARMPTRYGRRTRIGRRTRREKERRQRTSATSGLDPAPKGRLCTRTLH